MPPRISIITLGVADLERSYRFYNDGIGFPTTRNPAQGIVFFQMQGTCLALYPLEELAKDIGPEVRPAEGFHGITLAHNTRTRDEVDAVLERAKKAGGRIVKRAQVADWGGYSGYFTDPDGYYWEVAWSADWRFHEDGSLVID